MREIKYQAWNGKFMFIVGRIDFDTDGLPRSIYDINRKMEGDSYGYLACKLREYTGIKDKDGKEIYEGDVVKKIINDGTRYHDINDTHTVSINHEGAYPCGAYDGDCGEHEEGEYWEVIGNIHENPELLDAN